MTGSVSTELEPFLLYIQVSFSLDFQGTLFNISFSNAWKWKVKVKLLSLVRLLATPWTAASKVLEAIKYPSIEKQLIQYLHFMEY